MANAQGNACISRNQRIDAEAAFRSKYDSVSVAVLLFVLTALVALLAFAPSKEAYAAEGDDLELEVSYTTPLKCNTPITFTMTPVNGSGPIGSRLDFVNGNGVEFKDHARYQYLLNRIDLVQLDPESGYSYASGEVDPTKFKFVEDNTFTYTFLASGTYYIRFLIQDYGTTIPRDARKDIVLRIDDPSAPSIETVASNIASDCNRQGFKTEYEKALYMHDYIISNAVYDTSLVHMGASGVLLRGTGTCESYHRAFALLLNKVGIQCYRATGNGHVWSCVKLDGEWTQVDVTWDGEPHSGDLAYQDHFYFGITDDMTKLVHSEHVPVSSRPCTSYDRNCFIRSGEISRWSDPVKSQIESNIASGKTAFNVPAAYDMYPNVYNIIYPLVAYSLNSNNLVVGGKKATVEYVRDGSNAPQSLRNSYFKVTASDDVSQEPEAKPIPMYRLYNRITGEHFYTANAYERDVLKAGDWNYEGIGWYAPSTGSPVYRLYNPGLGDHHYTTNMAERDTLVREAGWNYEGIGWYSGGTRPLYRQYNPGLRIGQHNYTANAGERDALIAYHGWRDEGIGWYGL